MNAGPARVVSTLLAAGALALALPGGSVGLGNSSDVSGRASPWHSSVQAADWSLPVLLADIARSSGGTAQFAERRFVAALDTPVDTTGVLVFVKPARLEKRIEKPRVETLIIDGDEMTIDRNGQRRNFSLRQSPEAAAMVEGLRATLAGDRTTLERLFTVALEGSAVRWTMVLTPRVPEAARVLRQVRLSGERADLGLVEVDQSNGDRSVMRVVR